MKVVVDIYPWAVACEKHGSLVMEGVFRHADFLVRKYTPVIAVLKGEHIPEKGIQILSKYLDSFIFLCEGGTWEEVSSLLEANKVKVWISLAIDFVCPLICRQTPFVKVAIAHDILAALGVFGEEKKRQGELGLQWNDVFAYVSVTTLHQVSGHEIVYSRPCKFVKYGCFHPYSELPTIGGVRHSNYSLSVHSIYPRKRLEMEFMLAQHLRMTHFHVGKDYVMPHPDVWRNMLMDGLRWLGAIPDDSLVRMYQSVSTFISLSIREGFNMPPMEAVLHGVPFIYLSDTSFNREIYNHLTGAVFCSLKPTELSSISIALPITKECREMTFEYYRQDNVTRNLVNHIAALSE